jgi:hypothetical protein
VRLVTAAGRGSPPGAPLQIEKSKNRSAREEHGSISTGYDGHVSSVVISAD